MPEGTLPPVPVEVPIDHYAVGVGAFASQDPDRAPRQNAHVHLVPPADHGVKRILVVFRAEVPPKVGQITNARDQLTVYFPPDRFADFYSILRAEKPIFVKYTIRKDAHSLDDLAAGRDADLASFHLITGDEPLGEGPADRSGEGERG
jgi:hypothetical protein